MTVRFVEDHRATYGVEPICRVVGLAPSTYYEQQARTRDPARLPARAQRDAALQPEITRVWEATRRRYGAKKVWKELRREGHRVARCTVARLYHAMGLRGVLRGRRVRTTVPEPLAHRPQDLVQRNFTATRPNQLWVSDLTYVATWRGFVYVAFVTDAFSRRIVGGRAATSLRTDLALDALEQALYDRDLDGPLTHHSDRGSQPRDPLHRPPARGRHRIVGRQPRRRVRQRAGRNDQRALQDGGDPPSRPVAGTRGRRVRDAGVGRLVQQHAADGTAGLLAAGGVRSAVSPGSGHRTGRGTQLKEPPEKPGRFTLGGAFELGWRVSEPTAIT